MTQWSRRRIVAAGAAAIFAPRLALAQGAPPFDVVIVGAGAAGIAAARRLTAAGRRCVIVEAAGRVGGRCFTEQEFFGIPFDRGGRLLYLPEVNPVARLARTAGVDVSALRPGPKLRVGGRFAREGELEQYYAAVVRARRAIEQAAALEQDGPANRLLPRDLGDWRDAIQFTLGPYHSGKSLDAVSAKDFASGIDRDLAGISPAGCGALLAKLADGLPVRLSMPARRVAVWRGSAWVETSRGLLEARAAIVTVSTGVLASGAIRFDPALPKAHADAIAKLSLGVNERIAVEIKKDYPLGLNADELMFEQADGTRTAAFIARTGGTPLCLVEVGGGFARDLVKSGERGMSAFAADWLARIFGADIRKAIGRTAATRWVTDPLARGSASAASPGGYGARRILREPVRDRVFFAGEAVHETHWGTVGGAWDSGTRAAEDVIAFLQGRRRAR